MVIFVVDALPLDKYRRVSDPDKLECDSTSELKPLEEIVGQERALKALKFGLEIKDPGFNVYVAGMPGTGRRTTVGSFLDELAKTKPKADDWIYVNNFDSKEYEPNAIRLPAGMANQFKDDMDSLITDARRAIPKVFESDDYAAQKAATTKSIEDEKAKLFLQINASAQQQGFVIQTSPVGLVTIPVINGKPLREQDFLALPMKTQQDIAIKREKLNADLRSAFRQLKDLDSKGAEEVDKLNRQVSLYAIDHLIADLKTKYKDVPEISEFIDTVQSDILDNLDLFVGEPQQQLPPQLVMPFLKELPFKKYEVNVIVDNSDLKGAPVIVEQNPSYQNLVGRIEKDVQYGIVTSDFMNIRAGTLHKANGGYIVLPVEDLFRNPLSWDILKTTLKTGKITIEEPAERMGLITAKGIRPEPIPLDTKVVLIGTPMIYETLYSLDPDFKELFKVKAEFDTSMERNPENEKKYAGFICTFCGKFKIKPLDYSAISKMVEYGSRLAEDQEKLSTQFSDVADLIREANFYAIQENTDFITAKHVVRAIEEKTYRSNLIQEKIQEYIKRGIFLIETVGEKVGQVNGLSVIGLGDISFGRPSRVTASIGVGREGVIDIEREAAMGGPIHTKGVMILSGYLANKYSQDKPLSLTARLVFEQSYEGVEGDSASSTELYSILSALSGLPIKQCLAVTGSVNQKGEVQAIGGVNEKLEGYFEVCKAKGFTGEQGAMIPASNVQNLMLKEELMQAANAGLFRIYPVKSIDEGIEVLTGVKAGERRPDGTYDEGTVNYLVDKRLKEMAEKLKEFTAGGK
jgi:lon-related putative ATP-dependent protease